MGSTVFQLDRRAQQLRKLTEISRALTYAVSLEDVLELTVRRAADLLDAQRVVLMLADDEGLLKVRASHGVDLASISQFQAPLHETLIDRLEGLLRATPQERFLGVPLVVGGDVTGLLAVATSHAEAAAHVDDDEWLLSALADQAAVALEKTRLDQTAEFRERLIGIVSHDLRNPIAVILMASNVITRSEYGNDPGLKKMIDRIQGAAERAATMVRDLLDFTQARLGSGIKIGRTPGDLHAIVREVIDEMQIAHPQRDFVVTHKGDAGGEWDADRLAQVIGNLVSNAVSYSPSQSPVKVTTSGEPESVTLAVHNAGNPICPDMLPHLFEPMRRASSEMNAANRSVGLGLYIVKHLVEAHGGEVTVQSSLSEGTTFGVRLPRLPAT